MIVPQGGIWQEIRSFALNAIPPRAPITPTQPYSLSQWQTAGYYTCTNATSGRIELEAASADLGTALLGDVEHLLDHAAEHKATCLSLVNASDWPSSTWLLVTVYYWAFFSALAFTRLVGRTTWYLDASAAARISGAATPGGVAGAGSYRFTLGPALSATTRSLVLQRSRSRLHEAVWEAFYATIADAVAQATLPRSNPAEYDIHSALVDSANRLGRDWPSAVRNAVNYKPGTAYDTIRGSDCLAFTRMTRPPTARELQAVVDLHRAALTGVGRPAADVSAAPAAYARLLISFCFLVDAIVLDLHTDVLERQALVKQWKRARQRYLQRHGVETGGVTWPIVGVG